MWGSTWLFSIRTVFSNCICRTQYTTVTWVTISITLKVSMVISKAIRDAPLTRANSKPLNSSENGGLILHSPRLKTGVLHLSSEMSFCYQSAAIFLHQSLLCKWNMTAQHNSILTEKHYAVYVFICSLWFPPLFLVMLPKSLLYSAIFQMLWHITNKWTSWDQLPLRPNLISDKQ